MDLQFLSFTPTDDERAAVDAAVAGKDPARHLLLPALHAVNDRVGWISQGALNHICQTLEVPPADAYGVASFYSLFSLVERPKRVVHACVDLACKVNGAEKLTDALTDAFGPASGKTGDVTWLRSPCLGVCERAPAALVFQAGEHPAEELLAPVEPRKLVEVATAGPSTQDTEPPVSVPQVGSAGLRLLKRVGVVDPTSLDDYRATGGYSGLRNALLLGPVGVIREVTDSKLMGRGGAAFPTGRKWDATARQPVRPHYLVCNADESEPGTFKDRVLIEGDPFALVEAMTITAFATGCATGHLYLRGEYPRALHLLENAIAKARERGFLGEDIMGHQGFSFDIEIRRGAGAYICGEETAIFNSIEGFRGEPRTKPPFPVEQGLFGKPTVVNNVETLVNIPLILTEGCEAYTRIGTESSTGSKLFCLSGNVQRPGVYEVPFGATLGELLELAGGVPEGRELRAILLGGAAGGFVRPDELDLKLTMEDARAAGTTLGSGVVLVLDDTTDLGGFLLRIAAFFRDESCGQCVPCRIGTVRQEEALHRMVGGKKLSTGGDDLKVLREVGQVMRDSSICGLGQTAWNAIESAIDRLGALEKPLEKGKRA